MKTCTKCTRPALQKQASNTLTPGKSLKSIFLGPPTAGLIDQILFLAPLVYILMFLLGGYGAEPFTDHSMETIKVR